MVGLYLLITILHICNLNTINAESTACKPNEIYKSENITCICNENGEWPNNQCRLHSQILKSNDTNCEPGKLVFIECNVCRCDVNGKIDKEQCTKHKCKATEKSRRSNSLDTRCDPNKWYSFAPCRICYCINEHRLICNNKNKGSKVNLGKYELSQCGDIMSDMKELKDGNKPLRYGEQKESNDHKQDNKSSAESDDNESETAEEYTTKHNQITSKKAKSKRSKSKIDLSESEKSNMNKHEVRKVTLTDADSQSKEDEDLNKNKVLSFKLPNVFENLLNLVLRKSMVSLNWGNNCKPGTTIKVKCNTCFCLTNGKLLCTEKKCQ
ncbi:uncharacterized protein LOC124540286 [Vanessa cardui]|uniref:uncharacterized protein LOC124540286 n=1 Tax=Vanessa cardui TaxID=171605 RepID=UPI001F12F80B|nr:uncharacterized protein LOC124540286 [Vanessa cardui]